MTDWPALMDEETARAYLGGCCTKTFALYQRRGGLKPVNTFGVRVTRFARADLDLLVDSMRRAAATSADGETDPAIAAQALAAPSTSRAELGRARAEARARDARAKGGRKRGARG